MKKFVAGMSKDTSKADQPDGTFRDALNAVVNIETGTVNNEYGTTTVVGANIDVIGAIPIDEDRVVFLGLNASEECIIALSDPKKGESTILYKNSELNFKRSHPIAGEYRKDAKNDIIIYFTDNYHVIDEDINEATYVSDYNPPRAFNVTRQLQAFALEEAEGFTANPEVLYGEVNFNVEKLTLFPDVGTHTRIKNAHVREGGAVVAATYHLALAYADEDFVETNYFVVSNPLYVIPEPDNTLPADIVIGAQKGTVTTKSLHWELYVPRNVNYKYVQPAVIQRIGTAENVYKLQRVEIQWSSGEDIGLFTNVSEISDTPNIPIQSFADAVLANDFTAARGLERQGYGGGDDSAGQRQRNLPSAPYRSDGATGFKLYNVVYTGREDASTMSTLDIVADKIKYLTARTLTQLNDQLYLGNLISRKDIGFQRYAGNIKVSPKVKAVEGFDRRSFDIITLNKGYGTMTMPYWHASDHPRGFDGMGQTYFQSIGADNSPDTPVTATAVESMYPDYISAIADFLRYPSTGGQKLKIGGNKTGVQYTLNDATRRGYKDNRFTYRGKSFRRGDVYAFYISFVLRDGTETYAYHIPGRPPLPLIWSSIQDNIVSQTGYTEEEKWQFLLGRSFSTLEDEYLMENDKFTTLSYLQAYSHGYHPTEAIDLNRESKIYQYVDTSYDVAYTQLDTSATYKALRNDMGFWENENEFYPASDDFRLTDVNENGTAQEQILFPSSDNYENWFYNLLDNVGRGRRVRHHRMPSNYNRERSYIQYSTASIAPPSTESDEVGSLSFDRNYGALFFENTADLSQRGFMAGYETGTGPNTIGSGDVLVAAPWVSSHRDKSTIIGGEAYGYTKKRLITNETARILGIQLNNLKIPRHMLREIQGYKIYFAKKEGTDKLVAGQSLSIPCIPRYAASPNQNRLLARKGPYFNAFYAYGGLRNDMEAAMAIASKWRGAYQEETTFEPSAERAVPESSYTTVSPVDQMFRYYGNPVFTFHDFTLLRKRPSLNTITHVQCQAAIAFRHYQGGPGVFGTRKSDQELSDANPNDTTDKAKITTFPSIGWISQALGNTIDYNVDGEIYDTTDTFIDADEDVNNPYGNDNPPADDEDKPGGFFKRAFRRLRGKEKDVDDVEDYSDVSELRARRYRIRQWRGGAYIACAHYYPQDIYLHREIVTGGDHRVEATEGENKWGWSNYTGGPNSGGGAGYDFYESYHTPKNNQFTFVVDPGSKTYLPGQRNLKTPESSSFKGAHYIFNRGGESSIVMALVSGLPHLKGLVPWRAGAEDYDPWYYKDAGTLGKNGPYNIAAWGDEDKFLFPDAWHNNDDPKPNYPIPDYIAQNTTLYPDVQTASSQYKGLNYTLSGADPKYGFPMAWLINVCSAKTDVYTPFDKQTLVWTGFYHSIAEEFSDFEQSNDLTQGYVYEQLAKPVADAVTSIVNGNGDTVELPSVAYFKGNTTDEIYGGDTYITRYAFRTTSHSYGHSWFRASTALNDAGPGSNTDDDMKVISHPDAIDNSRNTRQKDVPDFLSLSDFGTAWGTTSGMAVWSAAGSSLSNIDPSDGLSSSETNQIESFISDTLLNANNWQQGNSDPMTALFTFMVESEDNIGLRHQKDSEAGVATKFFDFNTAAEVLFSPPTQDFTKQDNLLYEDHLNFMQDKKVAMPFPKARAGVEENDSFTNRVIRSKRATGSLSDRYREFLANDYADIPKNRGDITNLFTVGDTLYIHTEKALFQTKGNEQLELGSVKAFIGSGDIFAIAPTELQNSEIGYGGTTSFLSSVTTQFGHLYVDRRGRRVHAVAGGQIQEAMKGMEHWLRDNIPFEIERYGINVDSESFPYNPEATTDKNNAMGFHVGYDAKFKRIVLTKKERVPNQYFIDEFNAGNIAVEENMFVETGGCADDTAAEEAKISFAVNTSTHRPEGPGDRAKQIAADQTDRANVTTVTCGPIGLSNDTYFEDSGWTLSYLPELGIWVSRHSYMPSLYINGDVHLHSINGTGFYRHDNEKQPGNFYTQLYNFELEFIDNAAPSSVKLYSNVFYWADAKKRDDNNVTEFKRQTFPIFDKFYVYNVDQISGESTDISYLNNCRLVDKIWYLNSFRDMSSVVSNTNDYINTGKPNVVGQLTTSIQSTREDISMFTAEGVPNPDYIDLSKNWFDQKKFAGHYLGVRLISNNQSENLIHLYAAGTKYRTSYR